MNTFRPLARRALALGAVALALGLAACAGPRPLSASAIDALLAAPDRSAADRTNDLLRKPADMLAFIGVRPGMVALDVSAARGYSTELIARAVGPRGKAYGQNAPRDAARMAPAQPEGQSAPAPMAMPMPMPMPSAAAAPTAPSLAERAASPATRNIVPVQRPFEDPAPPEVTDGALDLVTLMFNYHDLGHMGVDRARMNRALFKALKSGGMYVIADHSGRPGSGISESGTLHRIEEAFLRQEVEAAGFRWVASGDFLRNPRDPRDRNTPQPPMPKDEFVLKFVKP